MLRFKEMRKKLRGRGFRLRSRGGRLVVIDIDSKPIFSASCLNDVELFREAYNGVKGVANAK